MTLTPERLAEIHDTINTGYALKLADVYHHAIYEVNVVERLGTLAEALALDPEAAPWPAFEVHTIRVLYDHEHYRIVEISK